MEPVLTGLFEPAKSAEINGQGRAAEIGPQQPRTAHERLNVLTAGSPAFGEDDDAVAAVHRFRSVRKAAPETAALRKRKDIKQSCGEYIFERRNPVEDAVVVIALTPPGKQDFA